MIKRQRRSRVAQAGQPCLQLPRQHGRACRQAEDAGAEGSQEGRTGGHHPRHQVRGADHLPREPVPPPGPEGDGPRSLGDGGGERPGILDAEIHALPASRRVDMRGIPQQQAPVDLHPGNLPLADAEKVPPGGFAQRQPRALERDQGALRGRRRVRRQQGDGPPMAIGQGKADQGRRAVREDVHPGAVEPFQRQVRQDQLLQVAMPGKGEVQAVPQATMSAVAAGDPVRRHPFQPPVLVAQQGVAVLHLQELGAELRRRPCFRQEPLGLVLGQDHHGREARMHVLEAQADFLAGGGSGGAGGAAGEVEGRPFQRMRGGEEALGQPQPVQHLQRAGLHAQGAGPALGAGAAFDQAAGDAAMAEGERQRQPGRASPDDQDAHRVSIPSLPL
ncbi:hypothetical protein ROTAS13_04346 [Roseomonas sp. TAS13]|nr:hypothetical protein ROTAS13_04346 [Roseomonas sp. TAS13]